jgi:TolB-like protein/Tfp pilus assembly protein PilF
MSHNPTRLSRFWQELKRRKVIYVITVYASAAFVIIELANNVVEPLNLPERLPTFVIIILAIGFPVAIIMSWIFDLTPEGMEKTKPMADVSDGGRSAGQNGWKIATYVSIAVITGLIILNLASGTTHLKAGDIQSLVVLPFDNFTGDDGLEYFVAGMHSSLIGDMGKISGLRVISKTSSNVYKGVDMSVPQIASELEVDAVVEAQVMCLGDSICLQVKVISVYPEEKQLWVADYKEEKSEILNLYNQVTKNIADEVMIELTEDEKSLLSRTRTVDLEAYEAYLRGHQYLDDLSEESLNKALEYLTFAVEKDPDWAPLYDGLAKIWGGKMQMGFVPPNIAMPLIYENLDKAFELDPDFAGSHFTSAVFGVWAEWNWEKGEKEFLKALGINPNDAMSRIYYAHLLATLQRFDEALIQGQLAVELDPMNPLILALFAPVSISAEDWEVALQYLDKALEIDPNNFFALGFYDLVAYRCGAYDKAFEALKRSVPLGNDIMRNIEKVYQDRGILAAYEEITQQMERRARNSFVPFFDMAIRYLLLGQNERALDWFETGLETHDPNMPYITTGFFDTEPLEDNPRFIAILEKMNLPLPEE